MRGAKGQGEVHAQVHVMSTSGFQAMAEPQDDRGQVLAPARRDGLLTIMTPVFPDKNTLALLHNQVRPLPRAAPSRWRPFGQEGLCYASRRSHREPTSRYVASSVPDGCDVDAIIPQQLDASYTVTEGRLNLSELHAAASTAPSASARCAGLHVRRLPAGVFVFSGGPVRWAPAPAVARGLPALQPAALLSTSLLWWPPQREVRRRDVSQAVHALSPAAGCMHTQAGVWLHSMLLWL